VISHRPRLHKHHLARSGQELIHLPRPHLGLLYPHLYHKCQRYRPSTPTCTFVPLVMRRSCPWRNSNTILNPITKRAGSPFSTASNDVFLTSFPFSLVSVCHRLFVRLSPVPGSRSSGTFRGRPPLDKGRPTDFLSCFTRALPSSRPWNIPSYRYHFFYPLNNSYLSTILHQPHDAITRFAFSSPTFTPPFPRLHRVSVVGR
jgi:hypothetical protein